MVYHFICDEWSKPNNFLFQLANVCIVFSNINLKNRYNVLYIRACLLLSSLFFALWGWIVLCSLDTFLWNLLFTFINIFHVSYISYEFYPFFHKLDETGEQIYSDLQLRDVTSKKTFHDLVYKNIWDTYCLQKGDIYCVEEMTPANKLSFLIEGRIAVTRENLLITELSKTSFIDAAHWFVSAADEQTQPCKTTLMALDTCRVITWNKQLLRSALASEPSLHAAINRIVGEHVINTFYFKTMTFLESVASLGSDCQRNEVIEHLVTSMNSKVIQNSYRFV